MENSLNNKKVIADKIFGPSSSASCSHITSATVAQGFVKNLLNNNNVITNKVFRFASSASGPSYHAELPTKASPNVEPDFTSATVAEGYVINLLNNKVATDKIF